MRLQKHSFINLPNPNASRKDLHMSADEAKRARLYFKELVQLYHIWVKRPKPGMDGGAAQFGSNTIYVPTIKNRSDFYLCLHEVGHMRQPPALLEIMDRNRELGDEAAIIDEYIAEKFALDHAQIFGLDTTVFEKHAKRCVFTYVQKVHQNGVEWAQLNKRVHDIASNWLGITETAWSAQEMKLVD